MSRLPHASSCCASTPVRLALITTACVLSAYLFVRPASADVSVGASSGDFLSFEVGGRSAGMAGAHTGVATGVTAQFWNPAGLATLTQPQVGAMHANWLQDLSYEWLGVAKPMGIGVGSLSVAYFHTPGIQGVDEFDNPTGDFRVYDLAVTAGIARSLARGFSIGANAKMVRQSLGTISATAPAVDFGARATVAGASIGAAVQNLGPGLSFGGSAYPLPREIKLGMGRSFWNDRIQLAADYNMPSHYYDDLRVGTELRAHPNVSLRVGYRHEFGTPEDPANGLSYGLGLHFHQLEVDYAMTPSNAFDNVHRLSFGYSFGSGSEEKKPEKPKPEVEPPPPPAQPGPKVIASAPETKAPSPKPQASVQAPKAIAAAPAAPTSKPATETVAQAAPKPDQALATASAPAAPSEPAPSKPAKAKDLEYLVILPGYWSKESAEAELKALSLLGFRIKDAQIEKSPGSGYQVRLARTRSKSNADDMAASLSRMSFRASVEVASAP
ncbi:MAG TPA: PorV/PorQ family protein [Candidatus Binatia bacterium]|nr:PorV/PorQ family protein [Candidatus Binatia bacterium]